jgi:cytidylate kinase
MPKKTNIIALDGPSGVGKSTISRKIAATLGYTYLDTGAMYRAVGLYLKLNQVDLKDSEAVAAGLKNISIQLLPPGNEMEDTGVILNGEAVSKAIRTSEISMIASKVSAIPAVRYKLTEMQRKIGSQGKIVAEGRDVGTVVFPDAAYKFFLDADIHERARRRVRQLHLGGDDRVEEEQILKMISQRDRDDSERSMAPLRKADDALLIDTTGITIEDVCEKILRVVLRKGS